MYGVILAGGGGTRLWPLSLPDRPKPFLPLLGDESLLQRTFARLVGHPELELGAADVTVVTERRYESIVRRQLPAVRIVAEPRGRNTAAAIALATLAIDRPDDDVMVVLPADHTIANEPLFRMVLHDACHELAGGALGVEAPLITLGVQVDRPATEYGYLIPDLERARLGRLQAYVLEAFREKPSLADAEGLRKQPGVAWNAGIFMWSRRSIRAALGRHTELLAQLQGSASSAELLALAYESIQPRSIDYAVMEPAAAAGQVLMAGMDVGWSDLGTWASLVDALSSGYGRPTRVVPPGESVALDAADLLVRREEGALVLCAGPKGTITSDGPMALLPAAHEHAEVVEALLDRVRRQESSG